MTRKSVMMGSATMTRTFKAPAINAGMVLKLWLSGFSRPVSACATDIAMKTNPAVSKNDTTTPDTRRGVRSEYVELRRPCVMILSFDEKIVHKVYCSCKESSDVGVRTCTTEEMLGPRNEVDGVGVSFLLIIREFGLTLDPPFVPLLRRAWLRSSH